MLKLQQDLKSLNIKVEKPNDQPNKRKITLDESKEQEKEAVEEIKHLEPFKEETGPKELKKWTWPIEGKFSHYYHYWMLIHCLYYQIFVVSRISFEEKP